MKKIALSPELIIRAKNKAGDLKKFTQELTISQGFNKRYRLSDEAYDALEKGMTGKFKDIQEAGRVYDRTGIYAGKTAPKAKAKTKSKKTAPINNTTKLKEPGMGTFLGVAALSGAAGVGTNTYLDKVAGDAKVLDRLIQRRKAGRN